MELLGVVVAVGASGGLMGLLGLASAQASEGIWRRRPALVLPCAILGAGLLMWLAFLVTWLAPPAGPYLAHIAAGLALAYCVAKRSWRLLAHAGPIALAASGITLTYLGLMYLWRSELTAVALAGTRFVVNRGSMPADNQIPTLLADRIRAGVPTHQLIGDWNGSDRPPLQSGWILLNDMLLSRLGIDADVLSFAAGVVAQLLWIPSLYALLRVVGVRERAALVAVLFTASTGTVLTNTIYTWPKVFSAALAACALTVLIEAVRRRRTPVLSCALAATLFTLAVLAHGAAAFAVPAVAVLVVLTLRPRAWQTASRGMSAAAASAVATYAPWFAFQRFYDPPGDRLLKWHLAGVIPIDGRSLLEALVDAYSRMSVADYLAARWRNLTRIVNLDLGVGLGSFSEAAVGARRAHEYLDTSIALSIGGTLLVLMAIGLLLHRIRCGNVPALWRRTGWLVVLMLPCLLFWSLALFSGGSTVVHTGSHLWILILLAVPAAWLASARPWLAAVAWVMQLALMLAVYLPFFGVSALRPSGMATLGTGLAILGGVAWLALRRPVHRGRVLTAT